jgi:hypothetical protein
MLRTDKETELTLEWTDNIHDQFIPKYLLKDLRTVEHNYGLQHTIQCQSTRGKQTHNKQINTTPGRITHWSLWLFWISCEDHQCFLGLHRFWKHPSASGKNLAVRKTKLTENEQFIMLTSPINIQMHRHLQRSNISNFYSLSAYS